MSLLRIATRVASGINVLEVNYDSGDDRSYGEVSFKAETPVGLLEFKGYISTDSSIDDVEATLDGQILNENQTQYIDPDLPHYYQIESEGYDEEYGEEHDIESVSALDETEAKQRIADAIARFVEAYQAD